MLNYCDGHACTCGNNCLLDILWLVLVLAETTEEEDVRVLGKRRAGCRWKDVCKHTSSEVTGMQEEWFKHPYKLHANRYQTACRGDEKELSTKKKRQTPYDWKKKKSSKVEDPQTGVMRTHHRQPWTFPSHHSSMTDKRVCWKWEKATQVQKKNNLLSAASIHFHGKGQ